MKTFTPHPATSHTHSASNTEPNAQAWNDISERFINIGLEMKQFKGTRMHLFGKILNIMEFAYM